MAKYVLSEAKNGYKFNLVASNGEIIATSEGYKSMDSCLNGVDSVKRNAPDAEVVEEEA